MAGDDIPPILAIIGLPILVVVGVTAWLVRMAFWLSFEKKKGKAAPAWHWNRRMGQKPQKQVGPPPLPVRGGHVSPLDSHVRRASLPPSLPAAPRELPYRRKASVVSKGEWAFFVPLTMAVKGKYRVFPNMRLLDVVEVPKEKRGFGKGAAWGGAKFQHKRIGMYHLDFIVCDPHTREPLLAIELDDRSHGQNNRTKGDAFKDEVLQAAGLPLLRVPCQVAYDPAEIGEQIARLALKATEPRTKGL